MVTATCEPQATPGSSRATWARQAIRCALVVAGALLGANVVIMALVANPNIAYLVLAFAAATLIAYGVWFERVPKAVHVAAGAALAVPIAFATFLGIYGGANHVDCTEDAVIVLGAGVNGERVTRPLARRLDAAIEYHRCNPGAYIVVTGGLGNRATITEAEAMARYLVARGVPEDIVLREEASTSTRENLIFADEILREHFPDGYRAALISSDFHMFRAVRTARRLGLDVAAVGATTDWYSWPVNYTREMMAVINHWLFE